MVDLNWCKSQNKGIKLTEPNENLSKEYLKYAEETLLILREIDGKSNMWLATSKYYFEYFCAYSILIRLGIKCEIHDCTLEICRILEKNKFLFTGLTKILSRDKELRIENQYYLKNKSVDIDYDELTSFLLNTKEVLNNLSDSKIEIMRKII